MKFSNLLPGLHFSQLLLTKSFQELHERHIEQFPNWSLLATRRKVTASYWLKVILDHYGFLILAGSLIVILVTKIPSIKLALLSMTLASTVIFAILFLTMYWPLYQIEFLPHLDNYIESYKSKHLEGIQECKKQQYSVITLMLIQHIHNQLSGLNPILMNKDHVPVLARQYGVSVKSVDTALQLIIRNQWNRQSTRKRTEILDDFETAREYFRQFSSDKAISMLDLLQERILQVH
jgi:hypothetical protein